MKGRDKNLPDLIQKDLQRAAPHLQFVDFVATAGVANVARQAVLMETAAAAGIGKARMAFLATATERDDVAYKSCVVEMTWRSFAWFMSESVHIVQLHRGVDAWRIRLSELMHLQRLKRESAEQLN